MSLKFLTELFYSVSKKSKIWIQLEKENEQILIWEIYTKIKCVNTFSKNVFHINLWNKYDSIVCQIKIKSENRDYRLPIRVIYYSWFLFVKFSQII